MFAVPCLNFQRFAVAGLVALALGGYDPYVKVDGVVRQPSGSPLGDVSVVLRTTGREPRMVKTGSDGAFDVGIVGADPRATFISFSRHGYRALEQVVGEEERRTMEITLQPE